jgi:hypothetical protein
METRISNHFKSFVSNNSENDSDGEFAFTEPTPLFADGGLTDTSVEATCQIMRSILQSSLADEIDNHEENINKICCRLKETLVELGRRIHYTESENIKAQILLIRFYVGNHGLSVFGNCVDLFFIVLVALLVSHKISTDTPRGNDYWCSEEISNVDLNTLNCCEVYFLKKLGFDVGISEEEYMVRRRDIYDIEYSSSTLQC